MPNSPISNAFLLPVHFGKVLCLDQPFFVTLDPDGYTRILNNLIQNVVTHSRADTINISLWGHDNHVSLNISDNGIGMKPENSERIFERLYKCGKGRSEKGSGLGLSIAYQLAEKMNGTLTVQSEPEKGSSFTLSFPLETPRLMPAGKHHFQQ